MNHSILKKKISSNKPEWLLVVSFKTELLSEYLIHRGYRINLLSLLPKIGFLRNRMIIDNDVYVDLNESKIIQEKLSVNLLKNVKNIYSVIKKQSNKLIKVSKKVLSDYKNTNNKKIIENLKVFFAEYQKTLALIGIPTIIDLTVEQSLKKYLIESKINNIDEAFNNLSVSNKIIETNQERYDLLSIALKQKNGKDVSKLIDKHSKKYGWLHSTLFAGELYTKETIINELKKIDYPKEEFEKVKFERHSQIAAANKIIKLITSNDGKKVARLLQTAVYIRTARLEWLNQACFSARPFLVLIANKLQISFEDLIYLLPEEIYVGVNEGIIKNDLISERKNGYALISDEINDCLLITGNELKNIKNKYSVKVESNIIKGLVACKGNVKGIVVIVKDRSEISKVQEGNILVTPLTTPDFIIGMKKSAAVITDLGGMTSHAAIVARELKKPCIVGTKIATKVLKDGDMVEVDADNGVVKIIK